MIVIQLARKCVCVCGMAWTEIDRKKIKENSRIIHK